MADASGIAFRGVNDIDIPTPPSGKFFVYIHTSGEARYKDDVGVIHTFPSIASFNGRTGAITPIQADYDSFFLTLAEGNANYQPVDATLTALASLTIAANSLTIGTASDSFSQTTFATNTFPARASSGNLVAKTIADAGLAFIAAASTAAETALLDVASSSLKGLMSASDKSRNDNWFNKAYYNVLDNGISTSNTGAQNVTAWDALLATSVDNATIFFPPSTGFYDFASVCAIPSGKHIRVMGGGNQKSIIRITSQTANIFTVGDWNSEFIGLKFISSVTRTAGAAINSGNNVGINVFDCDFNAMFNGIVYQGGVNAGNLALVRNCHFTDTINFSIQIDGANANSIITECTADCTSPAVAHLEVNACGSLLISNTDFIRATNNMRLNPDSGIKGVFSVYCVNVFFDTASGSSVKLMGGATGTNIQRIKFSNCWFSGSVTGCEFSSVTSTNKPTAIDFSNCDIYSNSAFGVLATEVQDFSMSNCRVAGNTTAGVRTNAVAGSVTKFTIQNNTIAPTAGIGANGIGIDIVAGTYGSYIVKGNNVNGNTSNLNIIDAGSVATTDLKQIIDNTGALLQGTIINGRGGVTSGTNETLLFNARIPANAVQAGQMFRFSCWGQTSGAGTLIFRTRVGANGTVADAGVLSLTTTTVAQATNAWQKYEGIVTVVSIGGAGTAVGAGFVQAGALILGQAAAAEVVGTIVTTAPWFIDITCACAVAGTFTVRDGVIESL